MTNVITVTINPAVDVLMSVDRIVHTHKMRCALARRDPGGGGINVARVLKRLGSEVIAVYPIGGLLGTLLRRLVDDEGVPCLTIGVSEETREDITVLERTTELQYRFIQPGPKLTEQEWQACLEAVISLYRRDISAPQDRRARFVVASGSLPPGVPDDFYSQIASAAQRAEARMVVDASGLSLKRALEAGVDLVKPSLSEFRELIGNPMNNETDCVGACRGLIDDGRVEMVALTLGDQGALLVLLRHNFRCLPCAEIGPTQQGHRDSVATRATINLRRIVAMEFGMWRSGRNGGPSGPISFGNCNFREQPGGTSS